MAGIQALRVRRDELTQTLQNLVDKKKTPQWTDEHQKQYDGAMGEIENIDVQIKAHHSNMERIANGGAASDSAPEWHNTETGQKIPVVHAKNGKFGPELNSAFPNREFNSSLPKAGMGEFMRGVAGMRVTETVRNSLQIGTDSAGGFTLPSYLQLQMLQAMVPASALLTAGAGVAKLEEGAKNYRIAAIDTVPSAAWRLESGTLATSEPTFRSVDITPRSLSFQFKVSRELLADSDNLDQALTIAIAQAFAKEIDRAGLRGSGTAPEIKGILNTANIQTVTNGANGASLATTAYTNFISAVQSILTVDGPMPTAAIMSPRSLTVLAGLLDTTNQPRRQPPILDNTKFIATSQIPNDLTVGTSSDCSEIYLGDFSSLIYFMREGISIQVLRELHAGTGEIGFACHTRLDVAATYPKILALITGVRP
ncbi:MAG TPA: phage major capsid protein [Nitrosospira sp.]|nr:phage major capsid protein [Nitrosospira sp.]